MIYIDELINEKIELERKIELITAKLAGSPDGRINSRMQYGKYRYCIIETQKDNSRKVTYAGKNNELLLDLAKRDYYKEYIKDLKEELKGIELYLKHHNRACFLSDYLERHPGIRELLQPALIDRESKYFRWATEPYERNLAYPEHLIYVTDGGFNVRSKSEQMIANYYLAAGLPFRYEDPVMLPNGEIIYPDFHIFSLKKHKEYYHEHNGMMLNDDYFKGYELKLRKLRTAGIIPGVNLLQTFEAEGHPLNPACIREIIDLYLK